MIHAKYVKPWVFPWNGTRSPEQIDRLQDLNGDWTGNREKEYEIGRDGVLGYKRGTPSFSLTARQFEYGEMAFWYALANKATPASGADRYIQLADIQTKYFDIAAFLTDDDDTFRGTIWFPKLRVNGFSLNIADPDSIVERNFDLIGEDYKKFDAKYFSYETATIGAPGDGTVLLDPAPIEFASGSYVLRVLRVRAGVVTELVEDKVVAYADNTWRYDSGTTSVIVQDCLAADVIKVYYPSSTAYTTTWTDNDVDDDFLLAESAEIYLKVGTQTRVYRLQSVGIDVSFDRSDYKEIGNSEVVQTGVKSKTVTVTLDRYAEDFSLDDILAADTTYPYINPRDYSEAIKVLVKIYSDKTHTTFKMGYLITDLTPSTENFAQTIEDYHQRNVVLESDNIKISDTESELTM